MRIIGVELRVRYCDKRFGMQQREIAVIPCDIEVVQEDTNYGMRAQMNATIHTDIGDITVPDFEIPFILDQSTMGLLFRQRR